MTAPTTPSGARAPSATVTPARLAFLLAARRPDWFLDGAGTLVVGRPAPTVGAAAPAPRPALAALVRRPPVGYRLELADDGPAWIDALVADGLHARVERLWIGANGRATPSADPGCAPSVAALARATWPRLRTLVLGGHGLLTGSHDARATLGPLDGLFDALPSLRALTLRGHFTLDAPADLPRLETLDACTDDGELARGTASLDARTVASLLASRAPRLVRARIDPVGRREDDPPYRLPEAFRAGKSMPALRRLTLGGRFGPEAPAAIARALGPGARLDGECVSGRVRARPADHPLSGPGPASPPAPTVADARRLEAAMRNGVRHVAFRTGAPHGTDDARSRRDGDVFQAGPDAIDALRSWYPGERFDVAVPWAVDEATSFRGAAALEFVEALAASGAHARVRTLRIGVGDGDGDGPGLEACVRTIASVPWPSLRVLALGGRLERDATRAGPRAALGELDTLLDAAPGLESLFLGGDFALAGAPHLPALRSLVVAGTGPPAGEPLGQATLERLLGTGGVAPRDVIVDLPAPIERTGGPLPLRLPDAFVAGPDLAWLRTLTLGPIVDREDLPALARARRAIGAGFEIVLVGDG